MVDIAKEAYDSVGVGRMNQKSEWKNDEVKAIMERERAARKGVRKKSCYERKRKSGKKTGLV